MRVTMICNTDGAMYVFRGPIIRHLLAEGHMVESITCDGPFVPLLTEMGVKVRTIAFSRHSVSPFRNIGLFYDLYREIRRSRPDIVHNFTHKPAIFGALAARLAGIRNSFVTITGLGSLFVNDDWRSLVLRQMLLLQYRCVLPFVRKVFFQNPDDLAYFVSRGILARDAAVPTLGSGIDLTEYPRPTAAETREARAQLAQEIGEVADDAMVILFPARGVPEKGFSEFYAAARYLSQHSPGKYIFLHAGLIDSESLGHLSAKSVAELAESCGVHYLGFKSNLRRYMLAADVAVLPSYREGVPRSLIEALALGKTIVASDVPGCREVVR
ncbi:MAG TPA: glycosyltransferase family 1 protein, partial [Haliea salexigens]|nr:glycosyltransferase family 1 protein [Haliea salexigens]